MNNSIIIIPARLGSSRLPNKPLIKIEGEYLIIRTLKQCLKSNTDRVLVATDSTEIKKIVEEHGGECILTDNQLLTGTDRVYEAYSKLDTEYEVIINVQGDEPLVNPNHINKLIDEYNKSKQTTTLITNLRNKSEYYSKNIGKVIYDKNLNLKYISRCPIPFNADIYTNIYKHYPLYAYQKSDLKKYFDRGKLKGKTQFENLEDIEILRFIELGIDVKLVPIKNAGNQSVDTPEDIKKVTLILKNN